MARLFISHSSKDTVSAIAFKQWLGYNGWPEEDVFLDVEDIGGGERWKDALRKAHARCEAVILLASPDALSSPECLTEVRKAEDFGKEIIVVLLRDLTINDLRWILQGTADRGPCGSRRRPTPSRSSFAEQNNRSFSTTRRWPRSGTICSSAASRRKATPGRQKASRRGPISRIERVHRGRRCHFFRARRRYFECAR